MLTIFLAQASPAAPSAAGPNPLASFIPIILIFVIMYFVLFRPQMRRQKEAAKLGRLFPPLALSGPPFIGGAGGMIEPRGLLGIWPTLAPRSVIEEYVRVSVEES